jgi:hypothetical protein
VRDEGFCKGGVNIHYLEQKLGNGQALIQCCTSARGLLPKGSSAVSGIDKMEAFPTPLQ